MSGIAIELWSTDRKLLEYAAAESGVSMTVVPWSLLSRFKVIKKIPKNSTKQPSTNLLH